jgi:hypothetical protein
LLVEVVIDGKSARAAFHKDDTVLLDNDVILVKTEKEVDKVVQTSSGPRKQKVIEPVVPADVVWLGNGHRPRETLMPLQIIEKVIKWARATTVTLPR